MWRKIKTWNVDRSCGSPSAHLQWVTLKASRRDRVVNDWVEKRISDWMVAIINKALGKRSYGEPSTRAPTLKPVGFIKKLGIDLWLSQIWAQLLTNFLYLCLAFTLQDHLVPLLLENFIWSWIKGKKMLYIYIYICIYICRNTGPILESKDIFQKKVQKGAKYSKIWAKMYKIWK